MSTSRELVSRRQRLIVCCVTQRIALKGEARALREKLSLFDIGLNLLDRLKKNPALITGLVAGLIVIKPRRLLPVLQTSLLAWQALRELAPTMKNILECRRANTPIKPATKQEPAPDKGV